MKSWCLPNFSVQIAPDCILEYLNFQNFTGHSSLALVIGIGTRHWRCRANITHIPSYAPPRTNSRCRPYFLRSASLVALTPSFCIMFLPALGRLYWWYFVCFGCFLPSDLGFLRFLRFLHPRFSVTCLVFIPCLLSPVGFTSRFYP